MIRKSVAIVIIAVLAFAAGWLSRSIGSDAARRNVPEWKLAAAIPDLTASNCVAASPEERKVFELAADTLDLVAEQKNILWLGIGAQKFLGSGLHLAGSAGSVRPVPICPPQDIYGRVSDTLTTSQGLKGRLEEYQLRMVAKFPHRSEYIVDAVANSAFNEAPQESEFFKNQDIRPLARTVLAGFGKQALKYAAVAYDKMSPDDSLGTGAAQVAAATGYPGALDRIQKMMDDILSSVPDNRAVPWDARNRLYELAYAIYRGGDDAKQHTAPIRSLMKRKVESRAPPFGMVELSPGRMCDVLQRIEGAASSEEYQFCRDDKFPLEQ
jgi:hypothetical protein